MSRAQPPQNPPPAQRLRVRYAKRGRLRFTSHRDVSRAVERAVVRARLPMAYSSGFNPHPRISYAGAAPTGAASEAEYLELALAERLDPEAVRATLSEVLPTGIDIVRVVDAESTGPGGLADRLTASRWRVVVDAPANVVGPALAAFLATDAVPVERMTKKGLRSFDCREPVLALELVEPGTAESGATERSTIELVLRHTEPAVRPDDVLRGIADRGGFEPGGSPLLTRLVQGPIDAETGTIGDPFQSPTAPDATP